MRHTFYLPVTLAITLAGVAACGDDVTDPDGLLESAEAEAIMRSAQALPHLPGVMEAVDPVTDGDQATLMRARELWDAGSALDHPDGAAQRRLAVSLALPLLAANVPVSDWVRVRENVDDWTATADAMLRHLDIPDVQERVEAAHRLLRRSDEALSDRMRIYYLLLASSELVETTPRYVARSMAREAEEAVTQAARRDDPAVPSEALERAVRLKDWSAIAVTEAEYLLAIQRAYYAIQLVERP